MPFIAAPVNVTEPILGILLKFSKSKTLPACQVQRAKTILHAGDGLNNMEISKLVGLGQDSVSKWRNRFLKSQPIFQEIAQKDPSCLEKEITFFLMDRPRPGCPANFKDEQIIKILEIACRNPADFGYECSHWSLNQLVAVIVKEGIADTISAKTVSRFLKYGEDPPTSRPLLVALHRKN